MQHVEGVLSLHRVPQIWWCITTLKIIQNTHEGVSFACENLFSFVVPFTTTFIEFQNGLSQSMENDMLKKVSNILY
ncbi:hypothetical protein AHAS_Ahas09G0103100 [Arachis hypogaea]